MGHNEWYERKSNDVTISCRQGGSSWELKCINNEWHGYRGNCSQGVTPVASEYRLYYIIIYCLQGVTPVASEYRLYYIIIYCSQGVTPVASEYRLYYIIIYCSQGVTPVV